MEKRTLEKIEKRDVLYIIFPPVFQTITFFVAKFFVSNPYNMSGAIDAKIPYINFFVLFYCSWYLLLYIFCPLIMYKYDRESLKNYAITYVLCTVICSIIFLIFPTTVDRQTVFNDDSIFDKIVMIVYKLDSPAINCFPSLHALVSMLWIIFVGLNKNVKPAARAVVSFISVGIILSVSFIKQHALVDVAGAVVVIAIVLLLYEFFARRKTCLEQK